MSLNNGLQLAESLGIHKFTELLIKSEEDAVLILSQGTYLPTNSYYV